MFMNYIFISKNKKRICVDLKEGLETLRVLALGDCHVHSCQTVTLTTRVLNSFLVPAKKNLTDDDDMEKKKKNGNRDLNRNFRKK